MDKKPLDKTNEPDAAAEQAAEKIDPMLDLDWPQQLKAVDAIGLEPSVTATVQAMETLKADTSLLKQINAFENSGLLKKIKALEDTGALKHIKTLEGLDASVMKQIRVFEEVGTLKHIKTLEALDASVMKQIRAFEEVGTLKHIKTLEALDTSMIKQIRAFEEVGVLKHIKSFENTFDNGLGKQLKAVRNLWDTGLAKQHAAIEAVVNPTWTRHIKEMEAVAAGSSLLASAKAFEWAYADPYVNTWLKDLQTEKFAGLLRTWKTANPITEVSEVVEAMSSKGLVESAARLFVANPPASTAMTAAEIADVQAMVDRAVDRAAQQAEARLVPFIETLVEEIRSQKDSRLKTFVLGVVVPLLIGVIFMVLNPLADYYIKRALEDRPHATSPRELKQTVRKSAVIFAADREQFRSFRFVSKVQLEVHTHPSSQSPVLGNLALGQVVMLLEKQKAWSSVAWAVDDESPVVHGWVYSRYVGKIV
jgi:hypothetical protein